MALKTASNRPSEDTATRMVIMTAGSFCQGRTFADPASRRQIGHAE